MITIRPATPEDIEQLIKLRLDFLEEDNPSLSNEDKSAISSQLKDYLKRQIPSKKFIAYLAIQEETIVSTAFMEIHEMPANIYSVNGLTGTILNVFTYPQYRNMGYATKILAELIKEVQNIGVTALSLNATEAGKSLYEKLGFKNMPYTAMRLKKGHNP